MEDDDDDETVQEKSFSEDERVQFVGGRLARLLKLKEDQWSKFLEEEENQKLLAGFFENRELASLTFHISLAGRLAAAMEIPNDIKYKALCIMKTTGCIETEDCQENLKFAELSGARMEHVMVFLEEDMERHIEIMKNKTYIVSGILSGKTLLPIPTIATEIDLHEMCTENKQDSYMRTVLHTIESMVIKWSHQIQDIVGKSSAQALLNGMHLDPQAELDFWKKRKDNLSCIYDQLQSPVVQKMIRILKAKLSSYYPTFQDIYKEVENALVEALDIELYLRPLQNHIQRLQDAEFPRMHILIPPLFHTICLIWSHSKFYNMPAQIIVLLQEFCNLFIDQDIFVTMLEFEKLEKLTFGGVKGKSLNDQICQLNEEFMKSCTIFKDKTYDPLDFNNMEFEEDYVNFKHKILEFERRLGTIFCVGFLDCSGLESAFKLLAMLGYFLEKPVIADIFSPNYNILLQMFDEELDNCKHLYDVHIKQVEEGNEMLNKNMPFASGNLKWSQEVKARIQSFWSNFSFLSYPVLESSEGALIYQKYVEMLTLLDQYEDEIYYKWKSKVDDICQVNLDQPLIKRNFQDGLLSVNFDPKLVAVLRDVKYLLFLDQINIPHSALEMYKKRETFAKWYNTVKQTVLEAEYPLIEKELRTIDDQLLEAEETFTWQKENYWEYTERMKALVHDLEQRLQKSKDNIKVIQKIMKSWMDHPLFSRKDNKREALLNTEDREDTLTKKFMTFREDDFRIHKLIEENLMLFKADAYSESWKIYLEFIDDIIIDGLFNVIMHNLNFFLENTEKALKPAPLFHAQMILNAPEIEFKPSMDKEAGDGFYDLVDELLSNIFKISAQVRRVATHVEMEHYQNDMDSMPDLSEARQVIMGRVTDVITKTAEFKNSLDTYAYLWVDDRSECMKQFLLYGHIDIYENLYIQMSKFEDFRIFEGWLKVDMKPFKISLLNIIKKWSWMFKEYLLRFVIDSLADLEEFIKVTDAELQKELKEGDYDGLASVMVHLLAVRDRQAATDELFEPLKDTIILLESYGLKMPDHIYVQVERYFPITFLLCAVTVMRLPLHAHASVGILEKPLEKKAGRNYGPVGNKKLVYFIDDMNMPEVDVYGTVQPHTLIRQHIDYGHWYDRQKLTVKEIHNCQYVACMNPTVGSFTINPRLQRHFTVFAMNFPSTDALSTIYSKILDFHFQRHAFHPSVLKHGPALIQAAIWLHQIMVQNFLPTAIKFHYIFNLRDLSNIFQGILFAKPECLKHPDDLICLWLHESSRVYGDKLVKAKDSNFFRKKLIDTAHKYFEGVEDHVLLQQPLIYCHFANGVADPNYMPVTNWEMLRKILVETLDNYNELNASMNLVLFEDAIQHVCRINRILESPRGYALLIGVGGSGKQSLSRLAAYIGSLEVFQITLKKGYGIQDLRVDLANLYIKSGAKNIPTVFLLTDAQVPDEHFLVLINDLLASGEVPDLFSDEDMDGIIAGVRNEIRALGLSDTRENCWRFFLNRVRLQLKIILCFSPVGSTLRVRARKFPAIVNCSAIDWFHEWPQEALQSVSRRFIEEMPGIKPQFHESICQFMAYAHTSVNMMSTKFRQNERRYNYTTPKSFLEQIMLYKNLLEKKVQKMFQHKEHLVNGIEKLKTTSSQVEDLKYKLASQEAELQLRNQDAEALITKIGLQTEKVSKEKAIADAEEQKVAAIQAEVSRKQKECEDDLVKAEPALVAATAALNTLNKENLSELKFFPNPPVVVINIMAAVMVLLANKGKVPKDRSWKAARLFMGKVDEFLQALINYDKEHIPENCLKVVKECYLKNPEFNPSLVRTKSFAAAGLSAWVINIVKFYEVYCDVEPKRQALAQANAELAAATEKLEAIRKKLGVSITILLYQLQANVTGLHSSLW
ncbi:hypothetical protein lerEdw1_020308 [Lerista edwardsae]|nr:hypothetical protein lerEdw1_020308 [Lerista edwardsae]